MAKGSSSNGVMRGKRGNSVYYKLTNSNNKETQGERTYVGKVANPKTLQQAMQRMKLAPAVSFYRAFKDEILDHSFEGVKYGGRCHSRFMKLALNLPEGYPYVQKDDNILMAGAYIMAQGSLNGFDAEFTDGQTVEVGGIALDDPDHTLGQWSQSIINFCPWVKDGDQLTFAFVLGGGGAPYSFVHRVVLDTTSTVPARDAMGAITNTVDGDLQVNLMGTPADILGFCVILSRPQIAKTNGSISWLRSNSKMIVNDRLSTNTPYFNQAGYNAAVESYMAASDKNVSSTWYLNQGRLKAQAQEIPANPLARVQMATLQCKDEDSKLYGKWLTAILDPADGVIKAIAGEGKSGYDMSNQGNHATNLYYFLYNGGGDTKPTDFTAARQDWDTVDFGGTAAQMTALPVISLAKAQELIAQYNLVCELTETAQPALADTPNP